MKKRPINVNWPNWPNWPFVVLAIPYFLIGLLHLITGALILFVFGGKSSPGSQPELLPIYGWLGSLGLGVFLLTIPLDFVAAVFLLRSRYHGHTLLATAAILNLPLIPMGTLIGVCTLALLFVISRENRRSPQSP